ncbi:MAG: hypothetical protein PUP93_15795 [Rhizonema sp. NSF051]|nr:hypothetical protein [Rhizonema sp. NSF051]
MRIFLPDGILGNLGIEYIREEDSPSLLGYTDANELIRPYQKTHRYPVVGLDNAWEESLGVQRICNNIMANLIEKGWDEEHCAVIGIDAELEVWILQDNQNVEETFRFIQQITLRKWL